MRGLCRRWGTCTLSMEITTAVDLRPSIHDTSHFSKMVMGCCIEHF